MTPEALCLCPLLGVLPSSNEVPVLDEVSGFTFPSVSVVDSSLPAHPAFPMKDLLLSEGVMAQEGSVWRNGEKSPLFPGKVENSILYSQLGAGKPQFSLYFIVVLFI